MTLRIFEKPSKLCGNCAKYGEDCPCKCHTEALFAGYHEECYKLPAGKVEEVTEFVDDGLIKNYGK